MAVTKGVQRKVVVVEWDLAVVQGAVASVSAAKPGGELIEKRDVANHGHVNLTFPDGFVGDCEVVVRGSKLHSDADSGTIHVD